jgi:DNA polymerase-1
MSKDEFADMRVLIVDGNNIGAIAWYGCCKKGRKPNAAQIVARFKQHLGKFRTDYLADTVYVCWDGSVDDERRQLLPTYKMREDKPDGYYELMAQVRKLVENTDLYISVYSPDKEADDFIGLIARYFDSPRNTVIIVSSDKDMFQLITDNVVVVRPNEPPEKRLLDKTVFKQKFGFDPSLFVDYYCMVGDSSDKIPGAKGIGKKTAAELVQKFGKIENIYASLDKVGDKTKQKLIESKADVDVAKKIMTLKEIPMLDWMVF